TSAAAPATCGEAMLVPFNVPKISQWFLPPSHTVCCVTATPGAAIAISGPRDENQAILSFASDALTATTPSYAAGHPTLLPLFPAAATTTTPRPIACSTASSRILLLMGPPRERLMTWAPSSAAKRIPSATLATVPQPWRVRTLIGIRRAQKASPAAPLPLLVVCAIVPAT